MAMQLKKDAEGHVVVDEDDRITYVDHDGEEINLDWQHAIGKVTEVSWKLDKATARAKKAEEAAEYFDGIDLEQARNAIRTVANLEDKKLIEAGEVDKLKAEWHEQLQTLDRDRSEAHAEVLADRDKSLTEKDGQIRKLTISNAFRSSVWLNQNVLPYLRGETAEKVWGSHFRVENGDMVPYKDAETKLYSKEKPGEQPDFEEAIQLIVLADPRKEDCLISSHAGGDDDGNVRTAGRNGAVTLTREQAKDPKVYRAAKKAAEEKGVDFSIAPPPPV